jgi:hypothetical protein
MWGEHAMVTVNVRYMVDDVIPACSVEAFSLRVTGALSPRSAVWGRVLPTLCGHIVSGVSLVAALHHAQVRAGGGRDG